MRKKLSMNRNWKFHLGEVELNRGNSHGDIYNTSKTGSEPGVPQDDFDATNWRELSVPHDWAIEQPFTKEAPADHGHKPRGTAWYRKAFLLSEEYKEQKLVLEFEGIATKAEIYVNGTLLKRNYSAYVPFTVDITDMVHFGKNPNTIAVYVDATRWEGWWYEGAGIFGNVWLHVVPQIHFAPYGIYVETTEMEQGNFGTDIPAVYSSGESRWKLKTSTTLENETEESRELKISYRLCKGEKETAAWDEKVLLNSWENVKIESETELINPLLWDVEHPELYQMEVRLLTAEGEVIDHQEMNIGFRTVSFDAERGFFLNHKPLKLFGMCNHQDFGGLGVAVPDAMYEYRIRRLKEMGCNAYRVAHGMAKHALIDACDRMGMLVMDENRHFDTGEESLQQLRTMVLRDRNHPSVFLYSIFNEEPWQGTENGMRIAKTMKEQIKKLQKNALITGAMHGGIENKKSAAAVADVCGINYQHTKYDEIHKLNPSMPIVATEVTSTFAVRGCYESKEETHEIACYDDYPSDWGANVRDTWKAIMEREFVAGGFVWTGFDYMGEPTPYEWPSVSSFFGMMDLCGFPKDAFYLSRAIFSKEPVCHILPHWNHTGKEGEPITVMSHTNCEEAQLYVNGKDFGKKPVNLWKQVTWEVPYEAGTIEMVGYRNGKEAAKDVKTTAGNAVRLMLVPDRNYLKNDGRDAVPVTIMAVDEQGREVPDAANRVTFTCEGAGLLGMCNGNPNAHEDFKAGEMPLFHGRCQAVVQSSILQGKNESGKVVLCASAEGLCACRQELELLQADVWEEVEEAREQYITGWKITSTLFEERPDPLMKIHACDMNSWMDIRVTAEDKSPALLQNQQGKYAVYAATLTMPGGGICAGGKASEGQCVTVGETGGSCRKSRELYFYGIWGAFEIYVNGKLCAKEEYVWAESYAVSIEADEGEQIEIRILIQCKNIGAGLDSFVSLREYK